MYLSWQVLRLLVLEPAVRDRPQLRQRKRTKGAEISTKETQSCQSIRRSALLVFPEC